MERIKVFYIINSLTLGGAERQMAELVRRLPRERFQPVLCSLGGENAYAHLLPGDQPRYVVRGGGRLEVLRRVGRWLAAERPHVIHSFMEWSNLVARMLAHRAGRPLVVTSVRSRVMRPDYALVEGLLSRRSDAVVVNSVGTRQELLRIQRVPARKVVVIGNIIDFDRFTPPSGRERQEARRQLGLDGTTFVLPGRISVSKHQLGLVLAAARLKRRGRLPDDVRFLLAGRVYNPSVQRTLQGLLRWHGLQGHFILAGVVSGARQLYAAADWVVLPSLYEGLPNAAIEAHACCRPLLVSRAANLDGIVAPGETGLEFPTGRVGPLAEALQRALQTSPQQAVRMGEAGRRRVLDRFDPQAALQQVVDLYERLLAGPREPGR